jgi:PAS domain-containing protein
MTDQNISTFLPVSSRIFYQTHFFPLLKMHGVAEEIYLPLHTKAKVVLPVLLNAVRREREGILYNDCVCIPMHQRNQYEDELLKAKKALQKSEAFVRRVADSLVAFVGVLTPDGVLIEANQTALEAANLQLEDVLGKPFEETYWWAHSPAVQQQLRGAIQQAASGERIRYDVEVRLAERERITIDFHWFPCSIRKARWSI